MDVPMSQYPIDAGPTLRHSERLLSDMPSAAAARVDGTLPIYGPNLCIINVDDVSLNLIIAELLT